MALLGYSAGSRSCPHFDWVRNITAGDLSQSDIDKANSDASSLFAFTWQMMRKKIPDEVIADFDCFMKETGMPRMGGLGTTGADASKGEYEVYADGNPFVFDNVELAPPSGVIGQNYSRCNKY